MKENNTNGIIVGVYKLENKRLKPSKISVQKKGKEHYCFRCIVF